MKAATPISVFCQWLFSETTGQRPSCAIVLHGTSTDACDHLIHEIAQYLNEYDGEADGMWLGATRELIAEVTADPSQRRLLGMDDLCYPLDAASTGELGKTVTALTERGHIIFCHPEELDSALAPTHAFHAGVGTHNSISAPCHITVDPTLISPKSIPHIIGDIFLEWLLRSETSGQVV